jgi:hypothetical protein
MAIVSGPLVDPVVVQDYDNGHFSDAGLGSSLCRAIPVAL